MLNGKFGGLVDRTHLCASSSSFGRYGRGSNNPLPNTQVQSREGALTRWTHISIRVRDLPQLPSYAPSLCSYHGIPIPTTKETRRRSPLAGYRHQHGKYRQGSFEHDTGPSCLWLCRYPSHYHPGKLPSLPRWDVTSPYIPRTRWPTIRIVWNSGYSVQMSVMPSNEEQMERSQRTLASPSVMR